MTRKTPRRKRVYRSDLRAAAAEGTRRAILEAARRLLEERGYGGMKMERIALKAGVALDTVYASVGKKPDLMKLLVETALSGRDEAVPAEEREYVTRIHAAGAAGDKLALYARALRFIHPRLAPVVRALRDASTAHPGLARLWRGFSERRRKNLETFARELTATGELRPGLGGDELADVLWTTSAPEFYLLLVEERGWSAERFEQWLAASWRRFFLAAGGDDFVA